MRLHLRLPNLSRPCHAHECHVDPQHSEARPSVPIFLTNKNLFIWLPSPLSAYHELRIFKVELHKAAILLPWNPSVGNKMRPYVASRMED